MLAFESQSSPKRRLLPNLLPCTIHHDGPIPVDERYWNPQPQAQTKSAESQTDPPPANSTESTTQESYLRGRKLLGRTIALPAGYEGVVAQQTGEVVSDKASAAPKQRAFAPEDEAEEGDAVVETDEANVEVKLLEQLAGFEEIVVWGHELVPMEEDVYVKGLAEWVGFAQTLHAYDRPTASAAD